MMELARHPEQWAPMGRAGRAFVRERFDQARLTPALLSVLGVRPNVATRPADAVA